ncbi:hypothetical protein PPSIR1_21214 [Plesiocystis pacifica SIR-1]|uniref:Uncharacterized protein n=1 Tax=Plesiocystis pacifica SIR-1 TaxID=391625 RepID=A6G3I2_9BACT|nr:hypothetical protein [Plesiocystis pacifica]EDM79589.1 hypothetical protein PPSIR1_21214 [Plesiocystis pacifica SIR-1]
MKELRTIQEESEATAFGLECRAREAERERQLKKKAAIDAQQLATKQQHAKVDDTAVEILEGFASLGAGAISTIKFGDVPVGPTLNYVLGSAAKLASVSVIGRELDTNGRMLSVLGRSGKVLLHSQLAILTRNLIVEKG